MTRERVRRALTCALLGCALAAAVPASAPAAVSITRAELSPSTTQAAAHPNVRIATSFSYDDDDDLKSIRVVLPQGLLGDPNAAARCAASQFAADACPVTSKVGTTSVTATATVLLVPTTITSQGDVYNLAPAGSEPARLGVVVRPEVAGMPQQKIFLQSAVTLGPETGYGLATLFDDVPRTSGGMPIRIDEMSLTLAGRGPRGSFMTNPTHCAPATMQVTATSYDAPSQPATASASFTPTGCESVSFAPQLEGFVGAPGLTGTGRGPPLQTVVTLPSGGANLAAVTVSLPADLAPDVNVLSRRSCPPDALAAVNCPPESRIGTAVASSPLAPTPLSGTVYLGSGTFPPPLLVPLTGVVPLVLHGASALPTGPNVGIANTFEGLPDLPVTRFALTLDGGPNALLKALRDLCGPRARTTTTATFTAQSGRTVTTQQRLPVAGCRPTSQLALRFRGLVGALTARFGAARGGAALERVRLTLPPGLVAGVRASARRILPTVYAGGRRLRGAAVRLRGRTLDVRVAGKGARAVSVRWSGLRATGSLARRLAGRPRLPFLVRVTDAGNATTTLRLRVRAGR